jgi:hypothetical protein
LQGTNKEKQTEDETITRSIRQKQKENGKSKVKKMNTVKKKIPTLAPVERMVEPYTPQQLFDQPADISVGQLLAMNPKLRMATNKLLRKPIVRKKDETQEIKPVDEKEKMEVVEDLLAANLSRPNDDKTSALYCEASIKHIRFPLIVDSGSAGSIISLTLLKDLDMEITQASKTIMVNVNGERRRPLGAVSNIPLKIHNVIIPMDAIVTDANSYAAIVGNDWLRKTKAVIDYNNNKMVIKWKGDVLEVTTECQEMPHHIVSIEASELEEEEKVAEEESEEEEDEEENEADDAEETEEERNTISRSRGESDWDSHRPRKIESDKGISRAERPNPIKRIYRLGILLPKVC